MQLFGTVKEFPGRVLCRLDRPDRKERENQHVRTPGLPPENLSEVLHCDTSLASERG
jgi:hypothetical protein